MVRLNAEALKTNSPKINIGNSFTAFVQHIQTHRPNGKEIRAFKEHLAALIRIAVSADNQAFQIDSKIITAFNLWFPKNEQQHILWPSMIQLSHEYFTSLQNHAVPLEEQALAGLAHSAMALDIYAWLAQRLHRVPPDRPQFITWATLKDQFGAKLSQMNNFKRNFRVAVS